MSTYATERFLRKQVRLRDDRIKALQDALNNISLAAQEVLDVFERPPEPLVIPFQELAATTAEAEATRRATPSEGWERNV